MSPYIPPEYYRKKLRALANLSDKGGSSSSGKAKYKLGGKKIKLTLKERKKLPLYGMVILVEIIDEFGMKKSASFHF